MQPIVIDYTRYMKHLFKLFAYTFMFGISFIGYLCLPDMVRMWRSGCTFATISDKHSVSPESGASNLYSLEGNIQFWDKTNYHTGDLVCVKKHI
jgi:hypothetical protein